jgi:hypothetical protein
VKLGQLNMAEGGIRVNQCEILMVKYGCRRDKGE